MQIKMSERGTNTSSSAKLVSYLDKEKHIEGDEKTKYFFSANRDGISKWEVIQKIDENGKSQGLKANEDRFYSIIIAPSQDELKQLGNNSEKLKEYTRTVMENYAKNFNKGLQSEDLVWYAKIENDRKFTYKDPETKSTIDDEGNNQKQQAKKGELKPGDNRHIHIVVSRCAARENINVLQEEKKERTAKLSPLTNHKGESKGPVQCGFDRKNFIRLNEYSFDKDFNYERRLEESFDYLNSQKNGKKEDYERSLREHKARLEYKQIKELEQNLQNQLSL
jgi:hypothetical protein